MGNNTKWKLQIQKQVDSLTSEVRAIRSVLIGRDDPAEIAKKKMKFFKRSDETRKVYLELDGNKTNSKITENLGMHTSNVSRAIKNLKRQQLIFKTRNAAGKWVWARDTFFEEIGLVDELKKM